MPNEDLLDCLNRSKIEIGLFFFCFPFALILLNPKDGLAFRHFRSHIEYPFLILLHVFNFLGYIYIYIFIFKNTRLKEPGDYLLSSRSVTVLILW